jgi:L-fuculose-phosphate aldolase
VNYVPGDLRDQLAHVGYDVVQAGLVCGSGGNLSARIPDEDAIWITASGTWL